MKNLLNLKNMSFLSFFLFLVLGHRYFQTDPIQQNPGRKISSAPYNYHVNARPSNIESIDSSLEDPNPNYSPMIIEQTPPSPAAKASLRIISNKKRIYNEQKMEEVAQSANLEDLPSNQKILKTY